LCENQGRTELVEPTSRKPIALALDNWSLVQQLASTIWSAAMGQGGEQCRTRRT
jgi:hypothetical protein